MSVYTAVSLSLHNGHHFVIHPFDEACVSPLGYDLRIGFCLLIDGGRAYEPPRGSEIVIPPGGSAFIITREHVWLSNRVVGTIHARGSLAARGLVLNSTTVDPNWDGQMTMLIHNLSPMGLTLARGDRFATLILHDTRHPTDATPGKNPYRVATDYGNAYGGDFAVALTSYITLETTEKREFDRLIRQAHSATWLNRWVVFRLRRAFTRLRNRRTLAMLVLIALILGLLLLQPLWPMLQRVTGMTQNYDPSVFLGQIAAIVSLVGVAVTILLTSGSEKDDGKQ